MPRATYTPEDKARVYVVLVTNEWNVKRTARDTGLPENTVRRWAKEWKDTPPHVDDKITEAVVEYVSEMELTRNLALQRMRERLQSPDKKDQGTLPQIATVFGVLQDKIDRAHGIGSNNTVTHRHELPSPDEIRATLGALVESVQHGHIIREEEIVDAEIIEIPALPSAQQA
jgi:transposase-like protein